MKVNIITNKNSLITNVQSYPLVDTLPVVEVQSITDIHVGYDKFINNQIVHDDEAYQNARQKSILMHECVQLKAYLNDTDYMAIKAMDGALTPEEYAPVKAQRQQARNRINEIEKQLKKTS